MKANNKTLKLFAAILLGSILFCSCQNEHETKDFTDFNVTSLNILIVLSYI